MGATPRDVFEPPQTPLPFEPGPETSAMDYAQFLVESEAKPMWASKRNGLKARMRWAGKSEEADRFAEEVAVELRKLKRWASHEEALHVALWAVQSRWPPLTEWEKEKLRKDQAKKKREIEKQWRRRAKEEAASAFKSPEDKPVELVQETPQESVDASDDDEPRPATSDSDCEWVYQNIGNRHATKEKAPSDGAWFWLLHVRADKAARNEFYRNRHTMAQKEKEKALEQNGRKEEEAEKDLGLAEVMRLLKEVAG